MIMRCASTSAKATLIVTNSLEAWPLTGGLQVLASTRSGHRLSDHLCRHADDPRC